MSYGPVRALDKLTLSIRTGEIFALLGPNGAGKSTTIRILVTLARPTGGSARVMGFDVAREPIQVRRSLGYVPQSLSIDSALTGRENIWLFAGLYDIPWSERSARVQEVLDLLELSDAADRRASTYSGGMVRRLELAQALVNRPKLLVLDEPTVGLDPVSRATFWERIQNLRTTLGTTLLISTHYMDEAEEHADRVALLHKGHLIALDTPKALTSSVGEGADLEDFFKQMVTGEVEEEGRNLRSIQATRRVVQRVG